VRRRSGDAPSTERFPRRWRRRFRRCSRIGGGVAVSASRYPRPRGRRPGTSPSGWGEVEDAYDGVVRILPAAKERDDAVVDVPEVDPLEAFGAEVDLVERADVAVEAVQVADEPLHPLVGIPLEQLPGERLVVAPLLPLGELLPMNRSFFPGVGVHVGVEEAEGWRTSPTDRRHLSSIERFRCTTSSWRRGGRSSRGRRRGRAKVSWPKWYFRWIGSFSMKESMSCIHPCFHFRVNRAPPGTSPRHRRPGGRLLRHRDRAGCRS